MPGAWVVDATVAVAAAEAPKPVAILWYERALALQARFRRIEVTVPSAAIEEPLVPEPGWIGSTVAGRVVRFTEVAYAGNLSEERIAARFPGAHIDIQPMTLRDVFVVLARHRRQTPGGVQ